MPELRKDPVTSRWVIISTERGKRPSDFGSAAERERVGFCPFCPGNEGKTPPEVLAYRPDGSTANGSNWHLRVVPNKFPALQIEGDLNRQGDGMYDKMNGIGAHEVVIETPEHGETLASMNERRIEDILWAFHDRVLDLKKDPRFRYILIFKNAGRAAGASLDHPHSQLIATPIIPKRVREELDGAKEYYNYKERCVFCDIVRQELNQGDPRHQRERRVRHHRAIRLPIPLRGVDLAKGARSVFRGRPEARVCQSVETAPGPLPADGEGPDESPL